MKPEIKYIELKSGYSDNGPAWIGLVQFSKTGSTVYFDGKAFRKYNGISGNHIDIETGNEYWISGIKKDMTDRHWAGGGSIFVEKRILNDYLFLVAKTTLDKTKYQIIEVETSDTAERIHEIENETYTQEFDSSLIFRQPNELTIIQLNEVIDYLLEDEKTARFNKARRSWKELRIKFEEELEKRTVEQY